eukprot:6200327-Pleurochrysis_carterae.AAC.1
MKTVAERPCSVKRGVLSKSEASGSGESGGAGAVAGRQWQQLRLGGESGCVSAASALCEVSREAKTCDDGFPKRPRRLHRWADRGRGRAAALVRRTHGSDRGPRNNGARPTGRGWSTPFPPKSLGTARAGTLRSARELARERK